MGGGGGAQHKYYKCEPRHRNYTKTGQKCEGAMPPPPPPPPVGHIVALLAIAAFLQICNTEKLGGPEDEAN